MQRIGFKFNNKLLTIKQYLIVKELVHNYADIIVYMKEIC